MTSHPVQITVSPLGEILPHGVLHASMKVYVSNTGSQPVEVAVSKTQVVMNGQACGNVSPPSWLTVVPSRMHLAPGKTETARMTVSAPKIHGSYDLVAVFGATGHETGPVHLTDSIGTQMVVRGSAGRLVIPQCGKHVKAVAPYVAPSGGIPVIYLIGAGILGAFLLTYGIAMIIRTLHRP